ncbi:MAG: 1-acyl-sn-glycerol-3-phosphate acyltransferase [Oscillospiraceae bacterium]|nr:1-acyl-sn-glycerol-3-phosphate acyltransferase [Oscillospiraceae bacterium]
MEHQTRHRVVWRLLRPLARLIVWLRFAYRSRTVAPKGPCIVVSNHVTDWDPLLVGAAFRHQMYFLASEHIMRLGFVSRLLDWLMHPIVRQKGGSAAGAVKEMLRVLKSGGSVALFPEGNRTWDGVTRDFPSSTGKLVKTCGASLVTFRLRGGYLSSPRWSGDSVRRGELRGELVKIYTPEELKGMSVTQINAAIARDIHVDAFEDQRSRPVLYRGRRLAENLETLLFLCPKCFSVGTLRSEDDRFFCGRCGFETRYSLTGAFVGGDAPFPDVRSWNRWQDKRIEKLCAEAKDGEAIFSDEGLELYSVQTGRSSELIDRGAITLYRDHLELPGGISLPVGEITGMSLRGPTDLYIGSANGSSFLLRTHLALCTHKYLSACVFLGSPVGVGV